MVLVYAVAFIVHLVPPDKDALADLVTFAEQVSVQMQVKLAVVLRVIVPEAVIVLMHVRDADESASTNGGALKGVELNTNVLNIIFFYTFLNKIT